VLERAREGDRVMERAKEREKKVNNVNFLKNSLF